MPGSQKIKGEKCSDCGIPNSLAVGLALNSGRYDGFLFYVII